MRAPLSFSNFRLIARAAPLLAIMAGAIAPALCAASSPHPATPSQLPFEIDGGPQGVDFGSLEGSVRPGNDFYRYGNGAALKRLTIPADQSSYGIFNMLTTLIQQRLRTLLESASSAASDQDGGRQVRALYRAFLDKGRIESLGRAPVDPELARLESAGSRDALAEMLAAKGRLFSAPFTIDIEQNLRAPDRYAVVLGQSGLGMPDRVFYLQPEFSTERHEYEAYVARMLRLAGEAPAPASRQAAEVVAFETRIAQASWSGLALRDVAKTWSPMTVSALEKAAPQFPWRGYLDAAGLKGTTEVVVGERSAFPRIAAVWHSTPLSTLKAWACFHLLDNAAPLLADRYAEANFEFREKELTGQPQERPRWERAVELASNDMGESLGRLYVTAYFSPEAKAAASAVVRQLEASMGKRIDRADWLSPQARAVAHEKLAKLVVKVGYPDKWRTYSGLEVRENDLFGDVERIEAFEWRRQVRELTKPYNTSEFEMTPQTVDAAFDGYDVVFPAGILQPPFFSVKYDAAVNYGAIGATMGHEITHAFDDQGRKFGPKGGLLNWWTPKDVKRFQRRVQVLVNQYDAYSPLPGIHVNGRLTLGENIADLGGLLVAYDAYHASLGDKPAPVINGLTGDQRFFLAYCRTWLTKTRAADLRRRLASDVHSPAQYRVNGVVRNVDAWYRAFDVKPGDELYLAPDKRARIW